MKAEQIEPMYLYANKYVMPAGKTLDIVFKIDGEYRTFEEIKWGQNGHKRNSKARA